MTSQLNLYSYKIRVLRPGLIIVQSDDNISHYYQKIHSFVHKLDVHNYILIAFEWKTQHVQEVQSCYQVNVLQSQPKS